MNWEIVLFSGLVGVGVAALLILQCCPNGKRHNWSTWGDMVDNPQQWNNDGAPAQSRRCMRCRKLERRYVTYQLDGGVCEVRRRRNDTLP
jgi:hypothetical protein